MENFFDLDENEDLLRGDDDEPLNDDLPPESHRFRPKPKDIATSNRLKQQGKLLRQERAMAEKAADKALKSLNPKKRAKKAPVEPVQTAVLTHIVAEASPVKRNKKTSKMYDSYMPGNNMNEKRYDRSFLRKNLQKRLAEKMENIKQKHL